MENKKYVVIIKDIYTYEISVFAKSRKDAEDIAFDNCFMKDKYDEITNEIEMQIASEVSIKDIGDANFVILNADGTPLTFEDGTLVIYGGVEDYLIHFNPNLGERVLTLSEYAMKVGKPIEELLTT